jgi:hypothetical protein
LPLLNLKKKEVAFRKQGKNSATSPTAWLALGKFSGKCPGSATIASERDPPNKKEQRDGNKE